MSLILSKKALKSQLIMSFKIPTDNISKLLLKTSIIYIQNTQFLNFPKNYSLNISCDYEKSNPTKIAIKVVELIKINQMLMIFLIFLTL